MTKFVDSLGLKRLVTKIKEAVSKGTWLPVKKGANFYSIEEGYGTTANGYASLAEGYWTKARGKASHAQGSYNYEDLSFIDTVGVGNNDSHKKNASVIYVGRDNNEDINLSDPKNGYQYLLGVGGYQGKNIAEGMKSVQEVIADLEKGVAASETMTVEEIREIMSA
jgi:hypothetical protein